MSMFIIYIWAKVHTLTILFTLLSVGSLFAWAGQNFHLLDQHMMGGRPEEKADHTHAKRAAMFLILGLLIPTKEELALMYVVPKLVDSQVIQKDVPEIYNLAISALKKELQK